MVKLQHEGTISGKEARMRGVVIDVTDAILECIVCTPMEAKTPVGTVEDIAIRTGVQERNIGHCILVHVHKGCETFLAWNNGAWKREEEV